MGTLIAGLIIFFGVHSVPSITTLRQALVNRLGEKGYQGLFAAAALLGFVLIVLGMARAPSQGLYAPPTWGRAAALWLMPLAMILLAAANMPSNIKRLTRHPMLWGVALWAGLHLLANGDRAGVLLFGAFALYAIFDMASANRRGAQLSRVHYPFARDALVVTAGLVAYAALLWLHPYLFGASPLG